MFVPAQVGRIGDLRDALRVQDTIQDDLRALVHVPPGAIGRALHAGRRARTTGRSRCWRCGSTSTAARVVSLQERHDRARRVRAARRRRAWRATTSSTRATCDKAIPPPPAGFNLVAGNRSWRVFKRCAPDVRVLRGE